jgi:hypothetical protein
MEFGRLGSSPSQEKGRERRTWDICSISNVTCKNIDAKICCYSQLASHDSVGKIRR